MSGSRRILLGWIFLVLASVATGVFGIFSVYIFDGYSVSSAFYLAWPVAAVFSGGIAALVIVGPVLALWSFWEIYILNAPHDGNLTILTFSLPVTIVLIVVAGFRFVRARYDRSLQVWPLTFLVAPPACAGLMILARWLSA